MRAKFIFEGFVGYTKDRVGNTIEIYENPKSIRKFEEDTKAVVGLDSNLYMLDDSYNMNHDDLKKYLEAKGKPVNTYDYIRQPHLIRYEDTNYMYASEGYIPSSILKKLYEPLRATSKLNPNLIFVLKRHDEANPRIDMQNPKIIKIKAGEKISSGAGVNISDSSFSPAY